MSWWKLIKKNGGRVGRASTAARAAAFSMLGLAAVEAGSSGSVTLTNEPGAVVQIGTTVVVSGTTDAQYVAQTVLLVNRKPVDAKQGSGAYALKWQTTNAGIGNNDLEVAVVGANGSRRVIARKQVAVVNDQPVTVSLPEAISSFARPAKLRIGATRGYVPEKATLWVDSTAERRELTVVDGYIEWDPNKVSSGEHVLSVTTRDAEGRIANSPAITVTVPPRFSAKVSNTVTITSENPDVSLDVLVAEGIDVKQVKGWIDVRPPVETDSPVSVLRLPAIDLESGKHEVRAELVTKRGEVYRQGPIAVLIDNQHAASLAAAAAAERDAAEAAEKAQREAMERAAAEEKERLAKLSASVSGQSKRTGDDRTRTGVAAFADAARLSATGRVPSRVDRLKNAGAIGQARGMCVTDTDGTALVTDMFTVTARLAKGKGSIIIDSDAVAPDFAPMMENARKFVLAYLKKQGRTADLSGADIHIGYQSNGSKGNGTAGAAAAAAIVSALLKTPVRGDVAITGAIRENGDLIPLESLDLKKAAALADPTVATVVIPQFRQNVEEVLGIDPIVLVTHRIVAAQDMNQVLRQALTGYDGGSIAKAASFFTQGIAQYAAGKHSTAVSYLDRAKQATPEDITIPLWISAVKKTSRQ